MRVVVGQTAGANQDVPCRSGRAAPDSVDGRFESAFDLTPELDQAP